MSQDLKHSDHLPKSKSEEEACQNERTLINDLRYNNSTTKLVELMLCSTCGARVEPPFRPTGSIPGECSKCSSSKSVYRILQEPSQESSESVHQHKKLRHYLLQRQIKPPSPVNSPGNIGPITEVVAARKRSFPSISHQGPIRIDERHQRQLVAARDIAEGEIILRESAIVGAPLAKDFYVRKKLSSDETDPISHLRFNSICLACCRNVQSNYKCKKCGFPMCDQACEQHPDHADFECEVFATNPVAPIVHTNEYKKIQLLRCLLLREKDPERWQKIMELDPHNELRAGNFCAVATTIALCKFIQQECHLKQFDVETINRIVGIMTVRSLNTWSPAAYPITEVQNNEITKATMIFYKAGLLTHDCKPNTRCIISQSGIGTQNFEIMLVASIPISKGQILSKCLVDGTRGTFQRRAELLESYYLACTCRRCMDPLEHSTFYSALKCPKCPTGYLLPGNPLSLDLLSVWLCNLAPRCDFIIVTSQVMDLLRSVKTDVENAAVEHSLFQEYQNLQRVLSKYREKILHKNHFYIMNIQYALIMVISQLLEIVNEEEALKLSSQQISLCRSCIDVVDVLRPGNNRIRGNLLYFFHEGLLMTFLVEAKRRMSEPQSEFFRTGRKQFEEILSIMKMGRACLILEPVGSPEHSRALKLSLDSSGLEPLLRYFNIQMPPSS